MYNYFILACEFLIINFNIGQLSTYLIYYCSHTTCWSKIKGCIYYGKDKISQSSKRRFALHFSFSDFLNFMTDNLFRHDTSYLFQNNRVFIIPALYSRIISRFSQSPLVFLARRDKCVGCAKVARHFSVTANVARTTFPPRGFRSQGGSPSRINTRNVTTSRGPDLYTGRGVREQRHVAIRIGIVAPRGDVGFVITEFVLVLSSDVL